MRRAATLAGVAIAVAAALVLYRRAPEDESAGVAREGTAEAEAPRGSWRKAQPGRSGPMPTEAQREDLERLAAIGYVDGSQPAGEQEGVVRYDRGRAAPGFNFYVSGHSAGAVLMDMEGRVVHRWHRSFRDLWPDYEDAEFNRMTEFWRRAFLMENGDVLAIFEGLGLVKVDRDSNVVWKSFCGAHHDLEIMPDGDIWVLTREAYLPEGRDDAEPMLQDFVSVLDAQGREKRRVSLLESFENSPDFRFLLELSAKRGRWQDLLHTNTLRVLDGTLAGKLPAFRPGNVLISCRNISTIAVVDLDQPKVLWGLRGLFRGQHDPRVLPGGSILLFNNIRKKNLSAALELDPASGRRLWEYTGPPEAPLFSRASGIVSRLANGNTLVVETDNGRALEVTPEKEVVWEFRNPERAGSHSEYVASLFDLVRVPADRLDWLEEGPR